MEDFDLSKTIPFICQVKNCSFSDKITFAEPFQFKNHLKNHDYIELQETAFRLQIIQYPEERRSPDWFVSRITEASMMREVIGDLK